MIEVPVITLSKAIAKDCIDSNTGRLSVWKHVDEPDPITSQ